MRTGAPSVAFEHLWDALLLVDSASQSVLDMNAAATELVGLSRTQLPIAIYRLFSAPEDYVFWQGLHTSAENVDQQEFPLLDSETQLTKISGEYLAVRRQIRQIDSRFYYVMFRPISADESTARQLLLQQRELESAFDATPAKCAILDLHGNLTHCNLAFRTFLGLSTHRLEGHVLSTLLGDKVTAPSDYQLEDALRAAKHSTTFIHLHLSNGDLLSQQISPRYLLNRHVGYLLHLEDISQQTQLDEQFALGWSAIESLDEGVLLLDQHLNILTQNQLANHISQQFHDWECKNFLELFGLTNNHTYQQIADTIKENGCWQQTLRLRTRNGNIQSFKVRIKSICNVHSPAKLLVLFKDLNRHPVVENSGFTNNSFTDPLTQLIDRAGFIEILSKQLQSPQSDSCFAVVSLDLDFFKNVNESLGHLAGDLVIQEVANRLNQSIRPGDALARLNGDEFIVLLQQVDESHVSKVVSRLQEHVFQPYTIDGITFSLTASLGIALSPQNGKTATELIRNAERAMHHVKSRGRAGARFYQQQMNQSVLSRMKMDHAMRAALKADEFFLVYQPQVQIKPNSEFRVEALIRWQSADQGLISPGEFIPLAEDTGFIVQIGSWVLDEACRQLAQWRQMGYTICLSVNVSAIQFQQPGFVDEVAEALITHQLPGNALELELTESSLVKDVEDTIRRLRALSELGIRLAIDDFGTGYSNLAYLKQFQMHTLKIDRSFVKNIPGQSVDEGLVRAMINMAQALGLQIIAEGVETTQQLRFLESAGCEIFQGFLFHRPQLPDAITEILSTLQPNPIVTRQSNGA